jgi:hypothetical protein
LTLKGTFLFASKISFFSHFMAEGNTNTGNQKRSICVNTFKPGLNMLQSPD